MKTYAWTGQGGRQFKRPANNNPQTREIVAARSKAEARRLAGLKPSVDVSETGNVVECATANAESGTVFWRPLNERLGFVRAGDAWPEHPELEHAADCGCEECNDGGEDFTDPAYPHPICVVQTEKSQ